MTRRGCPFCGSHDLRSTAGRQTSTVWVQCQDCGAQGPRVHSSDPAATARSGVAHWAAWNERVTEGLNGKGKYRDGDQE